MEARVVTPKQLAAMLGVSDHTAAAHMRKHPRCINIGLGSKEYLRLPLEAAEEIVSGGRTLSPIVDKQEAPKPKKKPKAAKRTGARYVEYRR